MWSRSLHTQFVEALLILGYHTSSIYPMSVTTEIPSYIYVYMPFHKYFYAEAVPKDIVQVMNVLGLCREQVASHM